MSGNSISVSAAIHARLRAHCNEHGIAIRSLLEQLLEPVLDGDVQIPLAAPPPDEVASARRARVIALVRAAVEADRLRRAAPRIVRGLSPLVRIPLSPVLQDEVEVRASRAGITAAAALDGAINAMLDHLARVPWCRACAQTIGDCDCKVATTGGRQ